MKYTRRAESKGWLLIKRASVGFSDLGVGICEYTKVALTREAQGYSYFKVVDGNSSVVGQECFMHSANAQQYLSDIGPRGSATVEVKYAGEPAWEDSPFKHRLLQQWADESFNGTTARITLNSVWGREYSPLPPGNYTIFSPDQSHGNIATTGYASATPGMHGNDVWFPVGVGHVPSSRYIHVGHLSEGCLTQHELTKWNAIYDYLISSRVPGSNGKYCGYVQVTR